MEWIWEECGRFVRGFGGLKLLDSQCRALVSFGNLGFELFFGCFRALRITIGLLVVTFLEVCVFACESLVTCLMYLLIPF